MAELIDRFAEDILPGKPAVEEMYKRHLARWKDELGATYLRDLTSDLIDAAYRKLLREPGTLGGDPLPMLVAVSRGYCVAGRLLPMLMVSQDVGSQPEQLRHRGSGQEEESGGEGPAERHGAIVE